MSETWRYHTLEGCRIYRLLGRDAIDLLQRISTADVASVKSGPGVTTLLTNEKGRVVDVVGVLPEGDDALLLTTTHDRDGSVGRWLERFIIMEDVRVNDASTEFHQSICYQPDSGLWRMPTLSGNLRSIPASAWRHRWCVVVTPSEESRRIGELFRQGRGISADTLQFHSDRVVAGVPWGGSEITDQRNPLEARLRSMINFTKGCYIGQEVVARLDTYRKVQSVLTRFTGTLPPGTTAPVSLHTPDGSEAGVITTIASPPADNVVALGFVRVSALTAETLSCSGAGQLHPMDRSITDGIYEDIA